MNDLQFKFTAARDLAQHLDQRLQTLFNDFMERCAVVNIDDEQATALALSVISRYATIAAHSACTSEDEFIALCRLHYHQIIL